jgi:hypothetical protein
MNALAKRLGIPAAVVLIILATAAVVTGTGYLDGRTFVGETGEKGKTKGEPETFVFKDGTFDPLDCHKWGFSGAPYTTKEEDGRIHFAAETKSDKEGTMSWKGAVQGDAISGTVVWTKQGQAPIEYWFKGTQKKD